ncbi:MAG: YitT family protein [Bacteroidales bacterium]
MQKWKKFTRIGWDYFVITVGTFLYCLAWDAFLIPNNIASGGLTGACTIVQFATNGAIPVPYSFITINTMLLLIGFLIMGKGFGFKTIYVIILSTFLFRVLPEFNFLKAIPGQFFFVNEKVLIPIIGGLLEAVGIGWVFQKGGSSGGTDIVALVINKFWPISPGKVFLATDIFIIASILLVPDKSFQDMIYGYIAMITFSVMIDFMLMGSKSTVQVLVFSQKYKDIAEYILHKLDRGVTALNAVGWYTQEEKKVLLILVRKAQVPMLSKAIKAIDKKAFVSVSPASGVYGEGFEEIKTGIQRKEKSKQNSEVK